ncbi:MAG: FHA domain-containing protein [Desulfobacteraceae bacterium]|jgi:pSer/pThr/pTyr-binding forkhead associated (FHA) protein
MSDIPHIIVQLVHIEGPLKGEIQDFSIPDIFIGRHPDCQVQFPKDVVTLSRKHAHIVREGNRFKLIDKSTNGTFVNGQRVTEAFLKDGDVITFSEGGPKVSFLTQVSDQPAPSPQTPQQAKPPEASFSPQAAAPPYSPPASPSAPQPVPPVQHPPPPQPAPVATPPSPPLKARSIKVPFAIQYGPALKSFQSLPITLGKGANCDFVINHPALLDQQAQIFFGQDQYCIKDLTGTNAIQINGIPIAGQTALQPDMQVSLSPRGPKFRFLGGGRLVEVEDPLPEAPAHRPSSASEIAEEEQKSHKTGNKKAKLFKRLFSS